MNYTKQDDYDSFYCIAGECPKSCCKGWQIVIDEESLENYENYTGDFKNRLTNGIDWSEESFIQINGNCSMLNNKGLCDLQLTLGEDALCYTCGMYPRHVEEFEGVRELSLSLSCPEVARMVINRTAQYSFIESEDDTDDDFDEFDYLLYTKLVDARNVIYRILFNRKISIFTRLAMVLDFSKELQSFVEQNRVYDMDDIISSYTGSASDFMSTKQLLKDSAKDIKILEELEQLDSSWKPLYKDAVLSLNLEGIDDFVLRIDNDLSANEETALEQITVLLIYTYFCGAVYDDEIYSKSALAVYSTLWIYIIYRCYCNTENLDELIKITYSYAREVEHSDLNLDTLEEYYINK